MSELRGDWYKFDQMADSFILLIGLSKITAGNYSVLEFISQFTCLDLEVKVS